MKKDCCKKEENLVTIPVSQDYIFKQCNVCGCKHHELTVDPGVFDLKGKSA